MKDHLVSVYTRAGVLAHVQSTNGDEWPRDVQEFDSAGVLVPLDRIDVTLEPTAAERAGAVDARPLPRSAGALFRTELEVIGGKVRYRSGQGEGRAIRDRVRA